MFLPNEKRKSSPPYSTLPLLSVIIALFDESYVFKISTDLPGETGVVVVSDVVVAKVVIVVTPVVVDSIAGH